MANAKKQDAQDFLNRFKVYWATMKPNGGEDLRLREAYVLEAGADYFRLIDGKIPPDKWGDFFFHLKADHLYFLKPVEFKSAVQQWLTVNTTGGSLLELSQLKTDTLAMYASTAASMFYRTDDQVYATINSFCEGLLQGESRVYWSELPDHEFREKLLEVLRKVGMTDSRYQAMKALWEETGSILQKHREAGTPDPIGSSIREVSGNLQANRNTRTIGHKELREQRRLAVQERSRENHG